ncbi:MAG: ABC transporter permease [Ardenticatenaceae bacterium]|nr:ABC transporter permease [Ardenticatenaceae bacterium]
MTNYLIRRAFQMIIVVLVSTIFIFLILLAQPGGPLAGIGRTTGDQKTRLSSEDILRIEQTLGLNRPFYLQYLTWAGGEDWVDELGNLLGNPGDKAKMGATGTWTGFQTPTCQEAGGTNVGADTSVVSYPCQRGILRFDFGESWSISKGQQVIDIISSRMAPTLRLLITVTVLSLVIAIPLGIISAVRQYSALDYTVTTFSFFGISMPVFWFGIMLIILFGHYFRTWGLPFFPSGGTQAVRIINGSIQDFLGVEKGSAADIAVHLFLPTMMLTLVYLAGWARFMRSSMLEVLRQDYVRTARAKGLRERAVIFKHAARNALIPLITIVVFQIPDIFSGAVLTETVFSYPGMGRLFIQALSSNDWPIVMAFLYINAILVVIATLVGDVLYTIVDPRIRFE